MKQCWDCKELKEDSQFYDKKNQCKACRNVYVNEWKRKNKERACEIRKTSYYKRREEDPLVVVRSQLNAVKSRALKNSIPFDLVLEDVLPVPDVCPALGIPLNREGGKNSWNLPELDRVIPELGYIKGNVIWLSRRANTIKNEATFEEIGKVYEWLRKRVCKT